MHNTYIVQNCLFIEHLNILQKSNMLRQNFFQCYYFWNFKMLYEAILNWNVVNLKVTFYPFQNKFRWLDTSDLIAYHHKFCSKRPLTCPHVHSKHTSFAVTTILTKKILLANFNKNPRNDRRGVYFVPTLKEIFYFIVRAFNKCVCLLMKNMDFIF